MALLTKKWVVAAGLAGAATFGWVGGTTHKAYLEALQGQRPAAFDAFECRGERSTITAWERASACLRWGPARVGEGIAQGQKSAQPVSVQRTP
jgi:hypothetical protein